MDDAIARAVPSVALVLPPSSSSSSSGTAAETQAASGSAVVVEVKGEIFLVTSNHLVGDADTRVSVATDGFATQHAATVVGRMAAVDLCLLSLPEGVTPPPAMRLGEPASIVDLEEGDFAIALSAVGGSKRALGIVKSQTEAGPSLLPDDDASAASREAPPGTAEAAMAEAEAAAEEDALARGEKPFLVVDAPSAEGAVGGPLLGADGALLGLTTLVISAGVDATRYYAVNAKRMGRAIDAMLERRSLGQRVKGARVVLFNDSINKRENVQAVLAKAGLSEQASLIAMISAHKTGRGVIGYFEKADEAKALVAKIGSLGKELPSALIVTAEACDFFKTADEPTEKEMA